MTTNAKATWDGLTEAQRTALEAAYRGWLNDMSYQPSQPYVEAAIELEQRGFIALAEDGIYEIEPAGIEIGRARVGWQVLDEAKPPLQVLEREGGSFSVYWPMNGAHYVVYDSLDHTPADAAALTEAQARIAALEAENIEMRRVLAEAGIYIDNLFRQYMKALDPHD